MSRVPSGGSLGAPSETRSSSTISSQGSTSAPRRAVARWVANEDIVYQIPRGRARGKGHFSRKSCRRPVRGKDNASERSPSWLLTPRRRGSSFRLPTIRKCGNFNSRKPKTEMDCLRACGPDDSTAGRAGRASRKPMSLLRLAGALSLRRAARRLPASLFQLPPVARETSQRPFPRFRHQA